MSGSDRKSRGEAGSRWKAGHLPCMRLETVIEQKQWGGEFYRPYTRSYAPSSLIVKVRTRRLR